MKHLFQSALILLMLVTALTPAPAQEKTVPDIGAIIKETEKFDNSSDTFCVMLWFPLEYWKASIASKPDVPKEQADELLRMMGHYTVILVVDAKEGEMASFTYTPIETIRKSATLTLPSGKKLSALADDDLSPGAKNLFTMMKPVLANMMGKFGENADFLIFPNEDKDGKKLLDTLSKGTLVLTQDGHTARWRLPLGSLMPPKVCPVCGET